MRPSDFNYLSFVVNRATTVHCDTLLNRSADEKHLDVIASSPCILIQFVRLAQATCFIVIKANTLINEKTLQPSCRNTNYLPPVYPDHHFEKNPPGCVCSFQLCRRCAKALSRGSRFWLVRLSNRVDGPWPLDLLRSKTVGRLRPLWLAEASDALED